MPRRGFGACNYSTGARDEQILRAGWPWEPERNWCGRGGVREALRALFPADEQRQYFACDSGLQIFFFILLFWRLNPGQLAR